MKKTLLLAAICSATIITTGCVSQIVPKDTVKFSDGSSWNFPKDITASNITVCVSNNSVYFHADSMVSKNSPEVLDKATAGQAAIIRTSMEGAAAITGAAVKAAAKP